MKVLGFVFVLALSLTPAALAHDGRPHGPGDLWKTWGLDPLTVIALALSGGLYFRGVRRLWRAAAPGWGIRRWEGLAYGAGWLALAVALVSPLHPLGEVLFSAHMAQHEILMLVAAPLLVLGRPFIPFVWALSPRWRQRIGNATRTEWLRSGWRFLTNPLIAWGVHASALWIWHVPVFFQATLESDLVHALQHLSFLMTALFFWWALLRGRQGWMGYGAAVLYVFSTMLHNGLLGALLTFATVLWYPAYAETAGSWGLTPLEDQQLGGLIMWVPAGLTYVIAGLALLAGWLREAERRVELGERQPIWSAER